MLSLTGLGNKCGSLRTRSTDRPALLAEFESGKVVTQCRATVDFARSMKLPLELKASAANVRRDFRGTWRRG
jgi:hypothetical protein